MAILKQLQWYLTQYISTHYTTPMAILFKKNIYAYAYRIAINLALLMRHNIEHHIIGSPHRIGTNAR